jgi:rod shape determining protein RodA
MALQLLERGSRAPSRPTTHGRLSLLRHVDLVLVLTACLLTVIGLVMVYSATRTEIPTEPTYYLKRQIVYAVIGFGVMLITMFVDYRHLEEWGYPLYILALLGLLAVRAIGHASGYGAGAVREITFGPLSIQPSEFAVLALIFVIGLYVHRHEGDLGLVAVAKMLALAAVPMLLVLLQPDLGTTIILGVVLFSLMVVAGVRLRYLVAVVALVVFGFVAAVHLHILHGYQLSRITQFLNQSCSLQVNGQQVNYNLCQSKTAIGAGGFRGTGLFHGAFTNNQYVPVAYADFIFSAIGEQLGFVGCAAVLGLFALIALRMFRAIQMARDPLGRLICAGALAFLVFSVFENVGMTMGLVPITGIPLPFISFGGSALFAFFAAVSLVANVEMRRAGLR